jgi:hypothetical protein
MKRRLLLFFLLVSSLVTAQNNIYRSGGITQTVGAPTFTPGASGNIVAIDTVTGEWYVNPNRLSGSSWISAGYRLTNISGSVPPAYTPTAHQSHFVVNAANQLYYWNGSSWQSVGGGGGSTDALRLKFIVVNKSGGTLNKGEVVYVSGAQGNRVAVKKALASADSLSANTLGVMDETVADNGEGYCIAEGLVSGINTSAFTEGTALYLSPTTAGAITQTKPTAPNHLVLIGYCVKSNNGSGEISVHIQNGYELGELHDVYVPAPSNGQVLTYNTTNTRWEAATVADQSATNEIQIIDTFSLSGQTLRASLSSDGQAAKTVTLPVVGITAGTNVTVSESAGVYTINSSGGGGGGITGTGVADYLPQWTSTSNIDTSGLYWSGGTLGIGTTTLNTTGIEVKSNTSGETYSEGPELLTTGTGTGWTGTSFATGYTHTTGTTALTANGLTVESGVVYTVVVTVTGRTVGTVTATMGGISSGNIATNTTVTFQLIATSTTANFSVATTNTFNGTVTASVKKITGPKPVFVAENSSGAVTVEIRAPNSPTNTFIGVDAGRFAPNVTNTTAIGYQALTPPGAAAITGSNSVYIGSSIIPATISSASVVAIGNNARPNNNSVVVGASTQANQNSVAIGPSASCAASASSVAIGNSASVGTTSGIAIGSGATTTGNGAICIGINTSAPRAFNTFIGQSGTVRTHLYGSLTMGSDTVSSGRLTVRGTGNTSSSKTAVFEDSGGSDIMVVQDNGVVGIGVTSPNASAKLEISSTTQGVLFPRMTTTQRGNIASPADGLVIYNTTDNKLQVRAGGAWVDLH